jgi:UDP-N-acetylmuramoyl-tripeptide--D-alanyl-D-alanine ligase
MTTGFLADVMRERGYRVDAGDFVELTGGYADSRQVTDGSLWTAFRGGSRDGNDFIEAALANGAAAVIGERAAKGNWPGRTIAVAPDARTAVGEAGAAWLRHCGPRVVGITGTVGKTTAKELTAAVLSRGFAVHRSKENFNSLEGLPLALVTLRESDEVAVLELAMDRPGEINELCDLVEPEIGVVLNIGLTHAAKLGSIEAIAREKLALPRWLPSRGTAVLNADDVRVRAVRDELSCGVIAFGTGANADLLATDIAADGLAGTAFSLTFEGRTYHARSPLPGLHTLPAALTALAVAHACGMEMTAAVDALGAADYAGRMVRRRGFNGSTLLDDRYNSSPASLEGSLRMLGEIRGRRIALLGSMAELGEGERAEHCRMGKVAAATCDVLAATGEPCRVLVESAREAGLSEARWFASRNEAAGWIREQLDPGDTLLLKASRSQAFEEIVPLLEARP